MSNKVVNEEYLFSEITGKIIAAAHRVHWELGPGFEERIYQRALALELAASGLGYSREEWMDIRYRRKKIGRKRVDFIIEDVMVELKARREIEDVDVIQTLSYLKASGYELALLLNFGSKKLGIKRLIHSESRT